MAGRPENTQLTFTRCIKCPTTIAAIEPATRRLTHDENGAHIWVDWNPASEAPARRPEHRTVSMWKDVRAALNHLNQVQFYLGHLPAKPGLMTPDDIDEAIRLQLDDARAVLGQLANALADGSDDA